jgi:hypothetical protein
VAAWAPDMFLNFYSVKNHKIVNNSPTTEAREKLPTDLESSELLKLFDLRLTKLESFNNFTS